MRWIGDGSVRDRAQTQAALDRFRAAWDTQGYGLFAAEEEGVLVGWIGLAVPRFLPEILPAVEIGWRLARGAWGRGLATEGARAVLAFGFDDVGLDRVVSVCHAQNTASEHVMIKLGMHWDRDVVVPVSGVPARCTRSSARRPATTSASARVRAASRPVERGQPRTGPSATRVPPAHVPLSQLRGAR